MMIQFSDIYGNVKGAVRFENGTLTGSNPAYKDVVLRWLHEGRSAQEFVDKYSNWSNGYSKSEIVPE